MTSTCAILRGLRGFSPVAHTHAGAHARRTHARAIENGTEKTPHYPQTPQRTPAEASHLCRRRSRKASIRRLWAKNRPGRIERRPRRPVAPRRPFCAFGANDATENGTVRDEMETSR